jgi:hypothetical protein
MSPREDGNRRAGRRPRQLSTKPIEKITDLRDAQPSGHKVFEPGHGHRRNVTPNEFHPINLVQTFSNSLREFTHVRSGTPRRRAADGPLASIHSLEVGGFLISLGQKQQAVLGARYGNVEQSSLLGQRIRH